MPRSTRITASILGPAIAITILYFFWLPNMHHARIVADGLFVAVSGTATLACLIASRVPGSRGTPWRWFAGGCAAWLAGSLAWILYGLAGIDPVPFPSLADIGYLAFSPLFAVGLVIVLRAGLGGPPTREAVFDSIVVAAAVGGLLFVGLVSTIDSEVRYDALSLAGSLLWQTATIAIIFLCAICLVRGSRIIGRAPLALALLGLVLFTIGNIIYSRMALTGGYTSGNPIDLSWQLGFLSLTAAAFIARRSTSAHPQRTEREDTLVSYSRSVATAFAGFALTALAVYGALQPKSRLGLAVAAGVIGIMLAIRLGYAALQGDYLVRRTRERDRLAAVVSASTAIAGSVPTESLLDQLVALAAKAVGRERAEIYVYTRDGGRVESAAFHGFTKTELDIARRMSEYEIGVFPAENRVLATQRPTVEQIDEPGISPDVVADLRAMGKEQTLVSPLLAHGEVLGVFAVWSPFDQTPFSAADIDAAAIISQQAGLAIYNARLLADARNTAAEQAALLRVSQASVSSTDMTEVLVAIARAALGVAGAEACGVDLWHADTMEVEVVSEETIDDWPGACPAGTRYQIAEYPTMLSVFRDQRPLVLSSDAPDVPEDMRDWFFTDDTHSVLIYPLMIGAECLGALNMYSRKPRAFSLADLGIVQEIADKAALGVQSARLLASTRRYAAELAALLEVSQTVVSGYDIDSMLLAVARAAVGVAGAEGCEIELYDGGTGTLEHVAHFFMEGWEPRTFVQRRISYPLNAWPASAKAIATRAPVGFLVNDADVDPDERRKYLRDDICSVLIMPLLIDDVPLGLLSLYSRNYARFGNETLRFAQDLAAQAALAVDRVRLISALQERADTDGLTGIRNHRAVLEALDTAIARARRLGGPFSVLLLDIDNFKLFNDTHGHLVGDQVLRATTALLRASVRDIDVVGRYGGDEFLVVLDGASEHDAELVATRLLQEAERTTVIVGDLHLPLKLSIGIAVYPHHATNRQDLISFADGGLYAAKEAGGGQARVHGDPAEMREPTTFGTLMGLVRAVDRKDRYTKVHSDLVTKIAVRFGTELQLERDELEALAIAGQLHDVGKIAVPDSILRKPDLLNSEETEILRQHVVFSELMVKGVPHLAHVTAAIAHHHERWDGTGYPHGVAGNDIPLLGRIMALADAWSAMTHDRPYRKRLSHEAAVQEVRQGAGRQFDPQLVEPFLHMIECIESERPAQVLELPAPADLEVAG
ncbi:MAG: hypothetical protein DCC58_05315 [Chloroflexi bacterium]|nr:MAG: hypothetical protein DCC58_05315 [Chloroflexota bacterium]